MFVNALHSRFCQPSYFHSIIKTSIYILPTSVSARSGTLRYSPLTPQYHFNPQ
jgi:hypothetical protein